MKPKLDPPQLARSLHPVQVASLQALAARLDTRACHLSPREMAPEEYGGAFWLPVPTRSTPPPWPPKGATFWPLPTRHQGYGALEAKVCQREGVVLLRHTATRAHALASYDAKEEAFRIGRAYCLLDFLPPYEIVTRLVQETPKDPHPEAPWTDVLLLAASSLCAQKAEEHAQAMLEGVRERRRLQEEARETHRSAQPAPARL